MYQFCALFGKVCDTTKTLVPFSFTYFYSLLLFSNKKQRVTYCLVLPLLTFICTLCNLKCFSRGHFNNKILKFFQILNGVEFYLASEVIIDHVAKISK